MISLFSFFLLIPQGKLPIAVSPDNMVAEQPSNTELLISVTSAFVGKGLSIIEEASLVATITGFWNKD